MSNHFYKYLARKIESYFSNVMLRPGDKYHIQLERKEQVQELMQEIMDLPTANVFRYTTQGGSIYETYCLHVKELRVIVGSTLQETTQDFLTALRNKVGTDEVEFQNTAILLIHESTLDSLIHGMTSFAKEGMPFHLDVIEADLRNLLASSSLTKTEQQVLEFVMENKKEEQTYQEQITLFDFEDIIHVLNQAKLTSSDFIHFGLFYDEGLDAQTLDLKLFHQRLEDNYTLFERVETVHKSGNPEQDLEKWFDQSGAKQLSQENWRDINYVQVHHSNEKKMEDKGLEYKESKNKLSNENVSYWERPDSETKAGQRIRHILLFNTGRLENLTMELSFSDLLNRKYIDVKNNRNLLLADASGKKLRLRLQHQVGQTNFYRVIYKTETSNKFEFRIASVECDKEWLEAFQTEYKIHAQSRTSFLLILSEATEWILNEPGTNKITGAITDEDDVDVIKVDDNDQLTLTKQIGDNNQEQYVRFDLIFATTSIPLALRDVVERTHPVTGFSVWKWKREKQEHCKYRIEPDNKMKILLNMRETYAQGEFRRHLDRERKIIESGAMYFVERSGMELELEPIDLQIPRPVQMAYQNLIRYFQVNKLLPSLAYLDDEYRELAKQYVTTFVDELNKLTAGQTLEPYQRNLANLGTIELDYGVREWLFTPLHPLNLAYQLQINDLLGDQALGDELLKTLRSTHLLPYVNFTADNIYKPVEQTDAYEWAVYVNQELPRYDRSRLFASKLIREKIEEFTGHFAYLFEMDRHASFKINLVNMGTCREVLQGIFEYYREQLKDKVSKHELLPIELHIYAESSIGNAFEELAQFTNVDEIATRFDLKLEVGDFLPEELLNIFRDKVRFYSHDVTSDKYEYCHVTFYQMRKIEQIANGSMSEIVTGVSLLGLNSGVPSMFINDYYKTGFGTKYYPNEEVPLLKLVPKLNSLLLVARTPNNYQEDASKVTAISNQRKKELDRVYDSAHWVTFVEPRVDLSFFKNSSDHKELLVIHYSDQNSSSSGFDAITVTRRSKQYQQLIDEFLRSHLINVHAETLPKIINFFNAINGNWLLRLLAQANHFPKEKISILSAVKMSLACFAHPNILWVPISMEEVLRVSGGTGLKQSEGLFSVMNLGSSGSYSDDLLLIGIEQHHEQPRVHLYPIEVKIGHNHSGTKVKAKKQVQETRKLLRHFLQEDDSFQGKYYRNFFMQMAVMSAEKMKLYEIWPEQDWSVLTDSELRQRLLNDDFIIVDDLMSLIGQGAIISFKKDVRFGSARNVNGVFILDYPERSGYEYILREIEQLKDQIQDGRSDIPQTSLLSKTYVPGMFEDQHFVDDEVLIGDEVFSEFDRLVKEDAVVEEEKLTEQGYVTEMNDPVEKPGLVEQEAPSEQQDVSEVDAPTEPQDVVVEHAPDKQKSIVVENVVVGQDSVTDDALTEHEAAHGNGIIEKPDYAGIGEPIAILFGHHANTDKEVIWYPTTSNKVMHTNTGIIGTMGTGKTQFTKSLITQLHRSSQHNIARTPIGILVFDYKGDYVKPDFVQSTGAKVYKLHHLPFNPLSLYLTDPPRPMLPKIVGNALADTIVTAFNLGNVQTLSLKELITDAYASQGILKNDASTWGGPAPTLQDLYDLHSSQEGVKKDSLYAALNELTDMEIFEPDASKTIALFEMIDGITVIDLTGFDESIQNLVVAITLDVFYNQMQMVGHSRIEGNYREITRMILVDEADNFLSKNFKSIKKILKEGREYGVGTILSTQFLSHFATGENDYANYILTWIIHNVSEINPKDIRSIFNTQSKVEEENIMNRIRTLQQHYSVVKGIGEHSIWMRDKAFWELLKS